MAQSVKLLRYKREELSWTAGLKAESGVVANVLKITAQGVRDRRTTDQLELTDQPA